MKQLKEILMEALKINSKSKVSASKNNTQIYKGLISDNWKYDSVTGGRIDTRKLFPKIDKQYLKDHPCTPDELNYNIKFCKGDKTWEDWQQKCNRIAKIIETWPADIIARKASMEGNNVDMKLLDGFVSNNDLKVITNRDGRDAEIGIYDQQNHGLTFTFKRK